MKSSFRRLRGMALHKRRYQDRRGGQCLMPDHQDELLRVSPGPKVDSDIVKL